MIFLYGFIICKKPNKETESTELMHRLQKKIVLNRRALNVLENLKKKIEKINLNIKGGHHEIFL